jgi:hypothetical protein
MGEISFVYNKKKTTLVIADYFRLIITPAGNFLTLPQDFFPEFSHTHNSRNCCYFLILYLLAAVCALDLMDPTAAKQSGNGITILALGYLLGFVTAMITSRCAYLDLSFIERYFSAYDSERPFGNRKLVIGETTLRSLSTPTGVNATMFYEIASFTYDNQKMERARYSSVSSSLAAFGANWPCLWGEEVTGHFDTWRTNWTEYKDGWKFTCGLRHITAPCVVYSLGSSGNMAFEKGLLEDNPSCIVHIFDKDAFGLEKWFPDRNIREKHVTFHQAFISAADNFTAVPPMRSLSSIMKQLGHTHIDILKMDIEGSEWDVLNGDLPSIGQLLVEVHENGYVNVDYRARALSDLFDNIEHYGLRLFHKEINARYNLNCIEFAFIQKQWNPSSKNYTTTGIRPAVLRNSTVGTSKPPPRVPAARTDRLPRVIRQSHLRRQQGDKN